MTPRTRATRQKPSTRLKVKRAQALLAEPAPDVIPSNPRPRLLLERMQARQAAAKAAAEASGNVIILPPSIKSVTIKPENKGPLTPLVHVTLEPEKTHSVTIMPDTILTYPSLWIDVFIHGDKYEEAQFAEMFTRARCSRAASPLECDLMVFTGGSDVNPELYGEERHVTSRYDEARDNSDIAMYLLCLEHGIPMFGVCRGAQFLHVMNDGKLFQDVDEHQGAHSMWDCKDKVMIERVSSVHHQMVRGNVVGGMDILGTTSQSRRRVIDRNAFETGPSTDIEAFYYRETNCLGVQGHPEYAGYQRFAKWTLEQIQHYLMAEHNPDMEISKGQHKLKDSVLKQRPPEIGRTKHLEAYIEARKKEK